MGLLMLVSLCGYVGDWRQTKARSWGCNSATLFLGDIHIHGSLTFEIAKYGVLWDSGRTMTELARSSSNNTILYKVKVTLRLTVSRSLCLVVEPLLVLLTKCLLLSCVCGEPSLTQGRVCHLPVNIINNLFSVILCSYFKKKYITSPLQRPFG
jgi:hypothetical protein